MRFVVLAPLFFAIPLVAQTWTQLPDFPGTARDDAAAFNIQDNLYVGTGREVGFGLTNDWWRFNTATETWSQIASLPASPRQYCAAFTVYDTAYVFGGQDDNGALAELWAYYPLQDQWLQKASLPAEARSACAASEGWGYGIVATGMLASGEPTNEAWRYWPVQDEWEALNPVPGPARHRAAGMPGFNGVVVAGGADSAFAPLADAWSFATWFETGEWYPAPALPEARAWLHGASNDLVLLLGGQSEPGVLHANCWKQGNTGWEALPDFGGGPRKGLVVLGQQESPWNYNCYAGLGIDSANVRKKDWWKLDVALAIDEHAASFIGIFPNPAKNWVKLKFPAGFTGAKVHVSDALGRSVFDGAVQNNALDVSSFAPGQYVVRGISGTSLVRGTFIKLP